MTDSEWSSLPEQTLSRLCVPQVALLGNMPLLPSVTSCNGSPESSVPDSQPPLQLLRNHTPCLAFPVLPCLS